MVSDLLHGTVLLSSAPHAIAWTYYCRLFRCGDVAIVTLEGGLSCRYIYQKKNAICCVHDVESGPRE